MYIRCHISISMLINAPIVVLIWQSVQPEHSLVQSKSTVMCPKRQEQAYITIAEDYKGDCNQQRWDITCCPERVHELDNVKPVVMDSSTAKLFPSTIRVIFGHKLHQFGLSFEQYRGKSVYCSNSSGKLKDVITGTVWCLKKVHYTLWTEAAGFHTHLQSSHMMWAWCRKLDALQCLVRLISMPLPD